MNDLIYNYYRFGFIILMISAKTVTKILFEVVVFFIAHASDFIGEHGVKTAAAKAAPAPSAKGNQPNDKPDKQEEKKTAEYKKRQEE